MLYFLDNSKQPLPPEGSAILGRNYNGIAAPAPVEVEHILAHGGYIRVTGRTNYPNGLWD